MTHTPDILSNRPMAIIKDECWLWPGPKDIEGYGRIQIGKQWKRVHRVIYELKYGAIPLGLTIDHLCRIRECINPRHLEAVTNKVNVLRGNGHTAMNARKTSCKHGHPFVEGNLAKTTDGGRDCLTCRRLITKRYEQRRRVQGWRQQRVNGKLMWIAPK